MPKSNKSTSTGRRVADLLQHALAEERQTPEFSDLTVLVEKTEFHCHRLVLAATSGFFRSLLSSGLREATERRVELHAISHRVFTDVVRWIYDGVSILTMDNVSDILAASDQLAIEPLFSECREFLCQNMSIDNCVSIYHSGCLFHCDELKKESWDFLLKNFDLLSSSEEELALLNPAELKRLAVEEELITRSEDTVIENILQWVRCGTKPMCSNWHGNEKNTRESNDEEICNKSCLPENDKGACNEEGLEKDETAAKEKGSITNLMPRGSSEEDFVPIGTGAKSSEEKDAYQSRAENLADLLKSTRYLLVSSNCVWLTLARDPLIQADSECRALQEEIVQYKTRLDGHQDEWLMAASHRATDQMRNAVLICFNNRLYCRLQWNDSWQQLNINLQLDEVTNLVYYDNNIYIRNRRKQLSVFMPRYNIWQHIIDARQHSVTTTVAMFPIGEELISVYKYDSESYAIESLHLRTTRQAQWTQIGKPFNREMEVASITNIGLRLVIFWKQAGQNHLSIECYDLLQLESYLLPDQLCSSTGLVTFKHGDHAFALQQNGALWRIFAQREPPFISIKHELCVWNFHRAVSGAMLVKDELWVFDTTSKPDGESETDEEKERVNLEGVFNRVRFCYVSLHQTGFVHAVIPKSIISS